MAKANPVKATVSIGEITNILPLIKLYIGDGDVAKAEQYKDKAKALIDTYFKECLDRHLANGGIIYLG